MYSNLLFLFYFARILWNANQIKIVHFISEIKAVHWLWRGRGGGGLVTSGLMYPCWSWWCLLSSVGALPHTHHFTAISSAMLSTSYKNYQ